MLNRLGLVMLVAACGHSPAPAPPPATVRCTASVAARPGTQTDYECPADLGAAACTHDVTRCKPVGRTRGSLPPGARCVAPLSPKARSWELGDDCAPVAGKATPSDPKGSICVMESGPGAYCTHDCATDRDCADLVRDGFVGVCSAGMCLLNRS